MNATQKEQWRPVVGYEGCYEISDHGNVRSLDRTILKSNGVNYPKKGGILKKKLTRTGYHIVTLWDTPKPKHFFVHRLVLEAFDRPRSEHEVCRHLDDNPLNNCLSNLKWGTPSENNYDAVRNGVHPMAAKMCCPRGHRFEDWNLVKSSKKQGRRDCLACSRARGYIKRHQELKPRLQEVADSYFEALRDEIERGTPPALSG